MTDFLPQPGVASDGVDPRFREIADAMPHLLWSTLPDGYHDYYNGRWYAFTGILAGAPEGARWIAVVHPDDRARAQAAWRHSLATGAPYDIEFRLRHHSGEYRWVLGNAQPMRDAQGAIVRWIGTCTDIHQQKLNEAALQDARLRQAAALVAADIGTWTYDIRADRVHADPNLAAIFGASVADADGGPLAAYLDAIHPDDLAPARGAILDSIASGQAYECRYRVRAPGGWRHVLARGKVTHDAAGQPAWLPGIVLDVSQQKEAEQALRMSEMRLRRLAESNVMGILRYRMDGSIIDANQAFFDMLGYAREDLEQGRLTSALLTPPEWKAANERVMDQLRRTGRMDNYVKEYYRKDGSRASVQMGAATVDEASGEGIAYVIDISPVRDAAEALRQADRRKDEFLAMLAHELRNPLAPIMAAADFLAVGKADDTRIRQVTSIVARQAGHMRALIDDLLDVSRVTRGQITLERAPVALGGVVAEAVEQVRPQVAAKNHRLALALPQDDAVILGDRKRLVQIVANLLGNAAKYTPEGGRIEVSVHIAEEAVGIDVSDNGIGMAPALLKNAFELFAQGERDADRAQGGLGIGLSLVRSLVELHGGAVVAQSDGPGRGSRFRVTLPRHWAQEAACEPAAGVQGRDDVDGAITAPAADGALQVLIVDDNVDAAQILALYVETLGHRATVWHSPGKALEDAARLRPDLCVLDIGLPEFDGHELAARLRRLPGMDTLPLVAVSGYGQPRDRARALAAGFDRHFVKPVRGEDIQDVLNGVAAAKAALQGHSLQGHYSTRASTAAPSSSTAAAPALQPSRATVRPA